MKFAIVRDIMMPTGTESPEEGVNGMSKHEDAEKILELLRGADEFEVRCVRIFCEKFLCLQDEEAKDDKRQ